MLARLADALPASVLAGVDLSPAMLAEARRRLPRRVMLAAADAERLPFAGGSFDAVVSSSSFHYW
ncbi:MAG: class I SAM-dependent methyltransferase, partial [Gemmatimonadales bacterium]